MFNYNEIVITRNYYPDRVIGVAILRNTWLKTELFRFYTLELPWRNNERSISCIPEGTYKTIKHKSPKFGNSFWLQDVQNRSEILIHRGNFTRDTRGCILPGLQLKDIDQDGGVDVAQSRRCMSHLWDNLPNKFKVIIQ